MEENCCHCHSEQVACSMKQYLLPAVAAFMLLVGIVMNWVGVPFLQDAYWAILWYGVAYLLVGLPVLREAWESICRCDFFNEFTLMVIATAGAFYIGEYPEGVAVMLFYTIGEVFQEKSVSKARKNITALLDVRPETAAVVREEGISIEVPEKVCVGDIIEVKVGERIPLDGVMLNEMAVLDTAALTGESMPRGVRKNEEVLAGMIVTDRVARVRVTKPYGQSALSRILELVQEASERKAPAELFIRKFAKVYTPIVTVAAMLVVLLPWIYSILNPGFVFVFQDWLYRALVFLVISCPCALVISVPLAYFGGIGAASRLGILFKGGNYLDAITKVNTVVFDKTGTLTKGVFEIQAIHPEESITPGQLLEIIVSLEKQSNHPIAKTIVDFARRAGIRETVISGVEEIAGYGLRASVEGKDVLVGNTRLLDVYKVDCPLEIREIPETIVCCAINGRYVGYILLADSLKADAENAIEALEELHISDIHILSGDKNEIVAKLAAKLGVKAYKGDLLPEGKVRQLEELRADPERTIAFVGDGINDAPVLAMSHVGMAMGGLGSDAAIETADVVIQNDRPSRVATAIWIGKMTRRIVWQNISLALGVKLVVLILGAGGMATLWEAVFADVGVALLAIFNAVRIHGMVSDKG